MPSMWGATGAGAADGLEKLLARLMQEQEQAQRASQFDRTQVETVRSNRADEGLRDRQLTMQGETNRIAQERQGRLDTEATRQHDITAANALADELPMNSVVQKTDPAVNILKQGGRESLLKLLPANMESTAISGTFAEPDASKKKTGSVKFQPITAQPERYQKQGTAGQIEAGVDNARQDAGAAETKRHNLRMENRPVGGSTVVVHTKDPDGNPITRIVPKTAGSEFPGAPTAGMQDRAAARSRVGEGVTAIENLSKQVINKKGIAQRATAAGRSVESALGNDPEYRVYQDGRFALAANLAVAQQGSRPSDADVKLGWLPMIPDVFADTDESAAMKWQLIRQLSGIGESTPGAGGGGGDPYEEYLKRSRGQQPKP